MWWGGWTICVVLAVLAERLELSHVAATHLRGFWCGARVGVGRAVLRFKANGFLHNFISCFISSVGGRNLCNKGVIIISPASSGAISGVARRGKGCGLVVEKLRGNGPVYGQARARTVDQTIGPCTSFRRCLRVTRGPSLHFMVSGAARTNVTFSRGYGLASRPTSSFPKGLARLLCRQCGTGLPKMAIFTYRLVSGGTRRLGGYILRCTEL